MKSPAVSPNELAIAAERRFNQSVSDCVVLICDSLIKMYKPNMTYFTCNFEIAQFRNHQTHYAITTPEGQAAIIEAFLSKKWSYMKFVHLGDTATWQLQLSSIPLPYSPGNTIQ